MTAFGHLRGTAKLVKAYQAGVLEVEDGAGKTDCMQWKTYVDLRSGELKATSLRGRVYKQDANGTVSFEATNCNLTGERCLQRSASLSHLLHPGTPQPRTHNVLDHPWPWLAAVVLAACWAPSNFLVRFGMVSSPCSALPAFPGAPTRCWEATIDLEPAPPPSPLAGDEKPGCTEAGNRGDGTFTVTAIMRATYVCKAGNCLKFAPLYNPEDDGHTH